MSLFLYDAFIAKITTIYELINVMYSLTSQIGQTVAFNAQIEPQLMREKMERIWPNFEELWLIIDYERENL